MFCASRIHFVNFMTFRYVISYSSGGHLRCSGIWVYVVEGKSYIIKFIYYPVNLSFYVPSRKLKDHLLSFMFLHDIPQGFSFSDLMYVTKRNMAAAVANLTTNLDNIKDRLSVSCKIFHARFTHAHVQMSLF